VFRKTALSPKEIHQSVKTFLKNLNLKFLSKKSQNINKEIINFSSRCHFAICNQIKSRNALLINPIKKKLLKKYKKKIKNEKIQKNLKKN
jgi:hypothetical protein